MKKTDLDEGACIYGATILLKQHKALAEEVDNLRNGGEDIEFIHRARVASRRLRATLPLFADCLPRKKTRSWVKEIRTVTQKLGEARDSDVQIEVLEKFQEKIDDRQYRPGINRLLLRLRQQRENLQQPVERAIDHLVESQVLDKMNDYLDPLAAREESVYLYTPALYRHSFTSASQRLDKFLSYDAVVSHPEAVQELHQMRIAAKWLRYTLEAFASLYADALKTYIDSVKEVQDLLGEIHDCDVWFEFLPQFSLDEDKRTLAYYGNSDPMLQLIPGIQYFKADRQQKREKTYAEFQSHWQQWKEAALWEKLRQTLQTPVLQPETIYPPIDSQSDTQAEHG